MVQIIYVYLIFDEVVIKVPDFRIDIKGYEVYITQFLACSLLHMELIKEVNQAIGMIKYVNDNPEKFTRILPPFCIGLMQLIGGLIAELANILMLSTRTDVIYCLEHFVAFELLTQIDDIYAHSLPHFPLKDEVEKPLPFDGVKKKFRDRSFVQKIARSIYKTVRLFYTTVYYYFTPFAVIYLPFFYIDYSKEGADGKGDYDADYLLRN